MARGSIREVDGKYAVFDPEQRKVILVDEATRRQLAKTAGRALELQGTRA